MGWKIKPNWRIKPLVQDVISLVPEPHAERVNQFFQKLIRSDDSDFVGTDAFGCTLRMLKSLNSLGLRCRGWEALEIGTGWDAISSLLLSQFETKRIDTIDLHRHVRPKRVENAIQHILAEAIAVSGYTPTGKLTLPVELDETFGANGIVYRAPMDLADLGSESAYNLVYSIAVLEHVPAKELRPFIECCYRYLRPGGISYHVITPADHFSWSVGGTGVLTPYNFLKYSDAWFNTVYNPRISHQNRWRCSQYLDLFQDVGFEILNLERDIMTHGTLEQLKQIKLAKQFQKFDQEDLATEQFYIVLRRN
jgi:hypothetical protein